MLSPRVRKKDFKRATRPAAPRRAGWHRIASVSQVAVMPQPQRPLSPIRHRLRLRMELVQNLMPAKISSSRYRRDGDWITGGVSPTPLRAVLDAVSIPPVLRGPVPRWPDLNRFPRYRITLSDSVTSHDWPNFANS